MKLKRKLIDMTAQDLSKNAKRWIERNDQQERAQNNLHLAERKRQDVKIERLEREIDRLETIKDKIKLSDKDKEQLKDYYATEMFE